MRRATTRAAGLAIAGLAFFALTGAHAQDVELLVKHSSVSNGPDGVKRSTEFSERVTRTVDTVWISRVLPANAHSGHDHAKGGDEHKHLDVATAARWITRRADGAVRMRLVPNDEKVLVSVTKPDFGNVGFDGSWVAAWSLIDPATLKRMKAGPASGDLTTYTMADKGRHLKIVWNNKMQIPALVQSFDQNSRQETVVQVVGPPASHPWDKLQALAAKDYSDYLD
jgi:hypothetical protein